MATLAFAPFDRGGPARCHAGVGRGRQLEQGCQWFASAGYEVVNESKDRIQKTLARDIAA